MLGTQGSGMHFGSQLTCLTPRLSKHGEVPSCMAPQVLWDTNLETSHHQPLEQHMHVAYAAYATEQLPWHAVTSRCCGLTNQPQACTACQPVTACDSGPGAHRLTCPELSTCSRSCIGKVASLLACRAFSTGS